MHQRCSAQNVPTVNFGVSHNRPFGLESASWSPPQTLSAIAPEVLARPNPFARGHTTPAESGGPVWTGTRLRPQRRQSDEGPVVQRSSHATPSQKVLRSNPGHMVSLGGPRRGPGDSDHPNGQIPIRWCLSVPSRPEGALAVEQTIAHSVTRLHIVSAVTHRRPATSLPHPPLWSAGTGGGGGCEGNMVPMGRRAYSQRLTHGGGGGATSSRSCDGARRRLFQDKFWFHFVSPLTNCASECNEEAAQPTAHATPRLCLASPTRVATGAPGERRSGRGRAQARGRRATAVGLPSSVCRAHCTLEQGGP